MSAAVPGSGPAPKATWVCVIILSGDVPACCSRLEHEKLQNAVIIPSSRLFHRYPIHPQIDPIRFSQWLTTDAAPTQEEWQNALNPHHPQPIANQYLKLVQNKLATWVHVRGVDPINKYTVHRAWNQLDGQLNHFRQDKTKIATVIGFNRKIKGQDERLAYTLLVVKAGPFEYQAKLVYEYCNQLLKQYIATIPPAFVPIINMRYREIPQIDGAPTLFTSTTTTTTSTTTNPIETQVFPMQKAVGLEIYNKIAAATQNNHYNSFRFVLLVPPRISLYNQSVKRYIQMFPQEIRNKHGTDIIIRAGRGEDSRKAYAQLIQSAQESPHTLYLLIQDECHWGMALGGQLDTQYLNSRVALDCHNLYILHVSATPYNILRIPTFIKQQIIKWDDVATTNDELKQSNQAYHGYHYLKDNNYIREHDRNYNWSHIFRQNDTLQALLFNVRNHTEKIRFSSMGWSIIFEYIINLHYLLSNQTNAELPFYSPHTQEILQSLLKTSDNGVGHLVVIRTNNQSEAEFLKVKMVEILQQYNKSNIFDVIADTSADETDDLWSQLSLTSKQRYVEWRNTSIDVINNQIRDGTLHMDYSQLKYLPLLLIVVDKGRMGDTFPMNFTYFDLRARYTNTENTYHCTLLQDVGRAFGYGERPRTYVAQGVAELIGNNTLTPHQTLQRSKPVQSNQEDNDIDDEKDFADIDKDEKKDNGFDPYVDLDDYFCLGTDHQIHTGASPNKVKVRTSTYTSLSSDHPALRRRFLLSAHPQNGKTGSVFYGIHRLWQHYNEQSNDDSKETKEHIDQLYKFRKTAADDLHRQFIDNINDIQLFIQWHKDQEKIDQRTKHNNHTLPYEKIIEVIKTCVDKSIAISDSCRNQSPFIIVDMGCGSARIAQHYHGTPQVLVKSIDHMRLPTVPPHIGVYVGSMGTTVFDAGSVAVVVFCLSLWGSSDDIHVYLSEAYRICSPGGIMLIIEVRNNHFGNTFNRNMMDELSNAILNTHFKIYHRQHVTLAGQDKYALWIAQKPQVTEVEMTF